MFVNDAILLQAGQKPALYIDSEASSATAHCSSRAAPPTCRCRRSAPSSSSATDWPGSNRAEAA